MGNSTNLEPPSQETQREESGSGVIRLPSCVYVLLGVCAFGCERPIEDPYFFAEHVQTATAAYDRTAFDSFRKGTALSGQITFEEDSRQSLIPPFPSRVAFDLLVPDGAPALQLGVGVKVLDDSDVWPAVEFRLSIDTGREEELLFQEDVDRSRPNRWIDRELDLTRWAGKNVRLTFETRLRRRAGRIPWTARRILPAWGNPFLSAASLDDRPSPLILISIDCLRSDHVGAYGYLRDTTPNLDRLAAEGTLFETSISTSSWTLPSHLSMLTGLYPSLHGGTKWHKLDPSIAYLPELLARRGYLTTGVVSWVYLSPIYGFDRGFHEYRVVSDLDTRAEEVIDAAILQVRKGAAVPHFLFIHLFDPHWPYSPPAEFLDRFGPRPGDLSDLQDRTASREPPKDKDEREDIVRLYDAEIAYTDFQLGRFIQELKSAGLYEGALILVTADHGEAFFEHGHWQHSASLYDEIVRVPLIVKWPRSSPSARVGARVSQIDIFATLASAAGIAGPWGEAQDLEVYRNQSSDTARNATISEVSWKSPNGNFLKISFRTDQEKYVAILEGPPGDELDLSRIREEELYDLTSDSAERKNLTLSRSDLEGFRAWLRAYLRAAWESRIKTGGVPVKLDHATRERLRSLGYTDSEEIK